jgi:hypothetical protein
VSESHYIPKMLEVIIIFIKRWATKFSNDKKLLLSTLLETMDRSIKDQLITTPGFDKAFNKFDHLEIWRMTKQVCVGRGAVSVYSQILKLLHCKQVGTNYPKFEKEYKDLLREVFAQGNAEEIFGYDCQCSIYNRS